MNTKEIILQKTFGLLLQRGYNGVSVTDIQQVTGMARGLLYHYFGNQETLFKEAVEKFFNDWFLWDKEQWKNMSITDLTVFMVERYTQIGQQLQQEYGEQTGFTEMWLLFQEMARYSISFSQSFQKYKDERYAMWKNAVLLSFSRGELRSGLNLESVAHYFVYIWDGIISNVQTGKSISEVIYTLENSIREFFEIIRR